MLTGEEQQHREELVTIIEQVLQAKGIECDERIGRMSDPELLMILGAARILRQDLKKRQAQGKGQLLAK
jgi:hypothetical protein